MNVLKGYKMSVGNMRWAFDCYYSLGNRRVNCHNYYSLCSSLLVRYHCIPMDALLRGTSTKETIRHFDKDEGTPHQA